MSARDYKSEYAKFQSSEKSKKDRAARNAARRAMVKAGKASPGDGRDVDHKNGSPRDNRPSNLQVISKSKNRAKK